ncbi:hypothetical protein KPH14_009614 [Odynerus spinipes]|uniref:Pentatricopeptide repeat-containing protein n=1 Tax=Odynerus spinipes TaxID=1348599 RepID=A0AAD9RQU3_9HYME|nr:hypothetical protein KPH14_009614 [Odynerus spinipes]
MRDTKFGNYKICDILKPELMKTELCFSETKRPDLLSNPPIFGTLPTSVINTNRNTESYLNPFEEESSDVITLSADTYLNDIFINNRLILFGGLQNILHVMQNDGVTPNEVTATLLLELLPNTANAEDSFLKYIKNKNIVLDIDFYNMLIKRRSMRKEYEMAKKVLEEIQHKHMIPNLMTFGVLALGCVRSKEGKELLNGLEIAGYVPNAVILGTLISNACHRYNTNYVIELLHYMSINKIKPSEKLLSFLENYKKTLKQMATSKKNYRFKKKAVLIKDSETFEREYSKWKQKLDKDRYVNN